jgi:GT2 family glycosyltransferase
MPDFLARLVEASAIDSEVGTVCGKLLSINDDLVPSIEPKLDSAGMFFTPAIRHFDRGWGEPDDGRFQQMEYVFGASAAAALYRREMIADVSDFGEFFDPDFFAYREDADVAWRAQLLGWRCVYTPDAVGYHVRRVVEGNRRAVPAVLNMHSVKNRFLMRIKNMTGDLYRRHWLPVTVRDVLVAGGCLLCEQTSLPAFWHVAKAFRRALRQRKRIMSRRRVSDESLAQWFSAEPSTQRVPDVVLPLKYRVSA